MVKVEVNHSTDFNDCYPKNDPAGDAHYSGGKEGSGQPALIYRADEDLSKYFSYYCFHAAEFVEQLSHNTISLKIGVEF